MNEFQKKENEGRKLFKSLLKQFKDVSKFKPSSDLYDTLDYYFTTTEGKQFGVEIKTRNIQYKDYDSHLMEKGKFISAVNRIKSKELDNVLYVNFFGDNICYIYGIRKVCKEIVNNNILITNKMLNRTTAVFSGLKKKDILLIPTKFGIKFELINNKWKLV